MSLLVETVGVAPSLLAPKTQEEAAVAKALGGLVFKYSKLGEPWAPSSPNGTPFVVLGFSNGVVRIRDGLRNAPYRMQDVKGSVLLDGTHAPSDPAAAAVVGDAYKRLLSTPGNHIVTTSRIPTPTFRSTRDTLALIGLPQEDGVFDVVRGDARIHVVNTPGKDAAEHVKHGAMARPMLYRLLSGRTAGGGSGPVGGGPVGGGPVGPVGGGGSGPVGGDAAKASSSGGLMLLVLLGLGFWAYKGGALS